MSERTFAVTILVSAAVFGSGLFCSGQQSSTSPREQLQQYVAQLQDDPNNADLREKIIKLAVTLKPPPAIADKDKVLELEGEAKGALKAASTQTDYSDAVKLFQKAWLFAPWDADLNYNLAKAQELAKQYDGAIASYKLYLLAAPDAKDHDAVVEKIGELKYEAQKSTQEATARAEQERAATARADAIAALLNRVRIMTQGAVYREYGCSLGDTDQEPCPYSRVLQGSSVFNWDNVNWNLFTLVNPPFTLYVENGKIGVRHDSGGDWGLEGTPNGPSFSDITWTYQAFPTFPKMPVWARLRDNGRVLLYCEQRIIGRPETASANPPYDCNAFTMFVKQ